jgi:hypothetical protein
MLFKKSTPSVPSEDEHLYTITTWHIRNTILLSSSPSEYPSYQVTTPKKHKTRTTTISRVDDGAVSVSETAAGNVSSAPSLPLGELRSRANANEDQTVHRDDRMA